MRSLVTNAKYDNSVEYGWRSGAKRNILWTKNALIRLWLHVYVGCVRQVAFRLQSFYWQAGWTWGHGTVDNTLQSTRKAFVFYCRFKESLVSLRRITLTVCPWSCRNGAASLRLDLLWQTIGKEVLFILQLYYRQMFTVVTWDLYICTYNTTVCSANSGTFHFFKCVCVCVCGCLRVCVCSWACVYQNKIITSI